MIDDWDTLTYTLGHDVVVAVRRAIWERHGNATEWAVLVIGDFRAGLINEACSYCSVHRRATYDDVVAANLAAREGYDSEEVMSWTSDFAKAYRQVAQSVKQLHLTVVAQWCPHLKKAVFNISAGQLFGGKTPPRKLQSASSMVVLLDRPHVWITITTHC